MEFDEARAFALSLSPTVTEDLFAEDWISFRIAGKWFMLMQLDTPEPRVAVKLDPERGSDLRDHYDGIQPAYHMNKQHWNDIYLNDVPTELVEELIREAYQLVRNKLPKKVKAELEEREKGVATRNPELE